MFRGKIKVDIQSATGLQEPSSLHAVGSEDTQVNPYLIVEVDEKELGRTSRQYNTLSPTWKETLFSDGSMDAEDIRFVIKHWSHTDDIHDFIGECTISISFLLDGTENKIQTFHLQNQQLSPQGSVNLMLVLERTIPEIQNMKRRNAFKFKYYKGHQFKEHTFMAPTLCKYCNNPILGLVKQGYKCQTCGIGVHKYHYNKLLLSCTGVLPATPTEGSRFRLGFNVPHQLRRRAYFLPTRCNHCKQHIFGQRFKCEDCQKDFHVYHPNLLNDCGLENQQEIMRELERQNFDASERYTEVKLDLHADEYTLNLRAIIMKSDIYSTVMNTSSRPSLEDLEFIKVLGQGAFGKVFQTRNKKTNEIFAVKAIDKNVVIEGNDVNMIMIEKDILVLGKEDNFLTRLHSAFQNQHYLFFVMEYVSGGDLFYHMVKRRVFKEAHARFYTAEMAVAILFLHKQGIIHRDLKLDNILLDSEGHIKVADFGMCKVGIIEGNKTNTLCGTPEYIAPEVLNQECYGVSCDWWSYGVILFEMIVGRTPFLGEDDDVTFQNIKTAEPKYPKSLSKDARSLLMRLLDKDVRTRIASQEGNEEEILEHSFFSLIDKSFLRSRKLAPPFIPSTEMNVDKEFLEARPVLSEIQGSYTDTSDMYKNAFQGFDFYNAEF